MRNLTADVAEMFGRLEGCGRDDEKRFGAFGGFQFSEWKLKEASDANVDAFLAADEAGRLELAKYFSEEHLEKVKREGAWQTSGLRKERQNQRMRRYRADPARRDRELAAQRARRAARQEPQKPKLTPEERKLRQRERDRGRKRNRTPEQRARHLERQREKNLENNIKNWREKVQLICHGRGMRELQDWRLVMLAPTTPEELAVRTDFIVFLCRCRGVRVPQIAIMLGMTEGAVELELASRPAK